MGHGRPDEVVSCVAGMLMLTLGGGFGLPLSLLAGSPFADWVVPGLILGIVVGGAQALAVAAQHARFALAAGLHVAAGLVMLTWVFVEIALLLFWTPLQGVYFATGFVQIVLAVLALGAWPRPFLAREPRRPLPRIEA